MNNLLLNGDMTTFEFQNDRFGNRLNTVYKPVGWTAFWYGKMMEWKKVEVQFPNRIHSDPTAAQWFLKWAAPNGGIYQVVHGLQPGARYRLEGWFQAWCVYENGNDVPGSMGFRVDAYGGTNPDRGTNIFGQPHTTPHNEWVAAHPVEFVASSDCATIFIVSIFDAPGADMNCYVDDVALYCIDDDDDDDDDPGDPGNIEEKVDALLLKGDQILEVLNSTWTIIKK